MPDRKPEDVVPDVTRADCISYCDISLCETIVGLEDLRVATLKMKPSASRTKTLLDIANALSENVNATCNLYRFVDGGGLHNA